MKPRRIYADFKVTARGYFRNPIALFFSLIFPIILIVLFGVIFSNSSSTTTLYVENLDETSPGHFSPVSLAYLNALNQTKVISVQVVSPPTGKSFAKWLGDNGDEAGLVIPAGFQSAYLNHTSVNLTVYTNPNSGQVVANVLFVVTAVNNAFNLQAAHGTQIVGFANQNVGSQVYSYVDFLVPGLIGFSILTSPMFSMVDITSSYRKEGIFRLLSLTPITRSEWLTGRILWYVVITFASAAIMLVMATIVFSAHVTLTLGMLPFLFAGPFFFVSLGMLAGSVAKTPETAAVIGNVITFPMMFLAGTFFPVSQFSPSLQLIAHALPLYYVIDGLTQVMLFGNAMRALTDLVIVLVLSAIVFLAAVQFFKWRDE